MTNANPINDATMLWAAMELNVDHHLAVEFGQNGTRLLDALMDNHNVDPFTWVESNPEDAQRVADELLKRFHTYPISAGRAMLDQVTRDMLAKLDNEAKIGQLLDGLKSL